MSVCSTDISVDAAEARRVGCNNPPRNLIISRGIKLLLCFRTSKLMGICRFAGFLWYGDLVRAKAEKGINSSNTIENSGAFVFAPLFKKLSAEEKVGVASRDREGRNQF